MPSRSTSKKQQWQGFRIWDTLPF